LYRLSVMYFAERVARLQNYPKKGTTILHDEGRIICRSIIFGSVVEFEFLDDVIRISVRSMYRLSNIN